MPAHVPLTVRRWRRAEYERLVDLGVFERELLELIGGELIVGEPQGAYHAWAVTKVDCALRAVLPPGRIVRLQAPVSLDDGSEPEPDLVVVAGRPGDCLDAHPVRPVLVVEVAESSLRFARDRKGSLSARAGIPEYWLVNLLDRVLEVYRDPGPDPSAVYGWQYRSATPPGATGRWRSARVRHHAARGRRPAAVKRGNRLRGAAAREFHRRLTLLDGRRTLTSVRGLNGAGCQDESRTPTGQLAAGVQSPLQTLTRLAACRRRSSAVASEAEWLATSVRYRQS